MPTDPTIGHPSKNAVRRQSDELLVKTLGNDGSEAVCRLSVNPSGQSSPQFTLQRFVTGDGCKLEIGPLVAEDARAIPDLSRALEGYLSEGDFRGLYFSICLGPVESLHLARLYRALRDAGKLDESSGARPRKSSAPALAELHSRLNFLDKCGTTSQVRPFEGLAWLPPSFFDCLNWGLKVIAAPFIDPVTDDVYLLLALSRSGGVFHLPALDAAVRLMFASARRLRAGNIAPLSALPSPPIEPPLE